MRSAGASFLIFLLLAVYNLALGQTPPNGSGTFLRRDMTATARRNKSVRFMHLADCQAIRGPVTPVSTNSPIPPKLRFHQEHFTQCAKWERERMHAEKRLSKPSSLRE
jgi:hypothetical protein